MRLTTNPTAPRSLRHTARRAARRSGFTLLEVLVVVAIIVMLAGVGGYYLFQSYEDAKIGVAQTTARMLAGKADEYKLSEGAYPQTLEALAQQRPSGRGPLLSMDKIADPWGKPFQIDPQGTRNNGQCADIFTVAPNGATIGNFSN